MTFFDRHGPAAAAYMTSAAWGLSMGGLMLIATSGSGINLRGVMVSSATALFIAGIGPVVGHVIGGFWHTVAVSGSSTPSTPQFSYEQSLVMLGKTDDALASFESVIAGDAQAIQPRILAAELYAGERNFTRAADLLREAQQIRPIAVGDDVYIANRLVDLYVGPLDAPGKALRELRRIIDSYGDTAAADHARTALAALKQRYVIQDS
jgi:hypothetical protein